MLDTMKKLDETGQRILFIAPEGKLKAVVTDGDIRICHNGLRSEEQIGRAHV